MDEQDRTQTEMAQTFGVTSLSSKKTVIYENRDEVERQQFITEVAHQEPEQVVFLDESGIDDNERAAYGYALKEQPCFSRQPAQKSIRHSFIAAVRADQPDQFLAPLTFEGYTSSLLVQTWLAQCLIPILPKGTMVVMDHASFHEEARVKALLEQAGLWLCYLPTYSPDLNPIEHS